MNQGQPNPQVPPNQHQQQPPDNRLEQVMERMRQLELQNTQLRTTVDFLKQPRNPGQQPSNTPPVFKPEVEAAIKDLMGGELNQLKEAHRQQMGYLADQLDQAKFQLNYGGEQYKALVPKVEALRQAELAAGRYIPREEALRIVHFEESGKKQLTPDPKQTQTAPEPKFDPFLQTYVGPDGKPWQGQPAQQPDPNQPQQFAQEQQQFAPQQMPWQQAPQAPPPQQTQNWQPPMGSNRQPMQTAHPYGNAYGQNFGLPGQGINPQNSGGQNQVDPRAPLSLEASDAELKAFEQNFGDMPL